MTTPSENESLSTSPKLGTGGAKSQPGCEAPHMSRLARLSEARFHVVLISAASFTGLGLTVLAVVPAWPMNTIAMVFFFGAVVCLVTTVACAGALYNQVEWLTNDNRAYQVLNDELRKQLCEAREAGEADAERTPNGTSASADRSNIFRLPRDLSIVRGDDGNGAA